MCTNNRYITNRYTGRRVLVPCGKCEACQEKKAINRAARIKNNYKDGEIALFVTLTYRNEFIPYVLRSDVRDFPEYLDIYRDATCRRVRASSNYDMVFKITFKTQKIARVRIEDYEGVDPESLYGLSNGDRNKISVPYYKDLQDFQKRLNIILSRQGVSWKPNYYQCNELGPTTNRSHFHLLVFIPFNYDAVFRQAICQAWPFADRSRTHGNIEIARNAASYVSKYVNRGSDIPKFLSSHAFRQKHSYSQGFALGRREFTFANVQKAVDRGALQYTVQRNVDGKTASAVIPIPFYVINKYFPQFKGYSRIAPDKIRSVISSLARCCPIGKIRWYDDRTKDCPPEKLRWYKERIIISEGFSPLNSFPLDYSRDDVFMIYKRLKNAFLRVKNLGFTGNEYDYAQLYERAWRVYKSTILRLSFDDVLTPQDNFEHYDNLWEYVGYTPKSFVSFIGEDFSRIKSVSAPTLDSLRTCLPSDYRLITNWNMLPNRVRSTSRLEDIYRKSYKKRKVNNYSINAIYGDV